jgi:hypothetical protein
MEDRVRVDRSFVLALLVVVGGAAAIVASFLPWVWVGSPEIPSAGIQNGAGCVALFSAGLVVLHGVVAMLSHPADRRAVFTSAFACAAGIWLVGILVIVNPWMFLGLEGPCCMLLDALVQPALYVTLAGGIVAGLASLAGALARPILAGARLP